MPFSQVIYYPWIDITDDAWLKTSLLYWDTIRTIVPESIEAPYSSETAQALESAGFLSPIRVHSEMEEIEKLTPQILTHLNTREGIELMLGDAHGLTHDIHVEKLPRALKRLAEIHPQKLPHEVRHILSHLGARSRRGNEWFEVNEEFAMFYMTLLANQLAERVGAAVVTPSPVAERLAIAARLDSDVSLIPRPHRGLFRREYDAYGVRRRMPRTLAPGLLSQLAIQQIAISPNTSIDDLLRFKETHKDEVARFRTKIDELASAINEDLPVEALRQRLSDIYVNQVEPAVADLKHALEGRRIRWLSEGLLKVASLSLGPSSMLVVAGLSIPTALLAAAGISLVVLRTMYNADKSESLRKDAFAYLLSIEQELT